MSVTLLLNVISACFDLFVLFMYLFIMIHSYDIIMILLIIINYLL